MSVGPGSGAEVYGGTDIHVKSGHEVDLVNKGVAEEMDLLEE
jgi:hypothetical protein